MLGFQPRRVSSILTARTKTDLRLAAQDARLSSEVTRVQIPQVGPFPLRLTAGCRTLNATIVVRIHEGEPMQMPV